MEHLPVGHDAILDALSRLLASSLFEGAGRSRALLTFIVEAAAGGRVDRLKEYTIGSEALGRGEAFDPRIDPIVRAEASRLRSRLERYYATEGKADPVEIVIPKGGYAPQFLERRDRDETASKVAVTSVPPARYRIPLSLWLAGGGLVVCAFALGIVTSGLLTSRTSTLPPDAPMIQFDAELRTRGTLGGQVGSDIILSPDGTRVVFVSIGFDGISRLNTRRLDESRAAEIPGTNGARGPFFSPDGSWVGFWTSGKLKKTAIGGGSPVVLCDANDSLGASWGDTGQIVIALGGHILSTVADTGGTPRVILDLTKESAMPRWPQFMPGAKSVLFTAVGFSGPNHATIEMLNLATGKRSVLVRGGTFGRYLSNGYVTYVNQGTLFALPADANRPETHGNALPVLPGVSYSSTFGFADLDFSQTGVLVYGKRGGGDVSVRRFDSDGKNQALLRDSGHYLWPSLSPNGKRLLLSVEQSGESGVSLYDLRSEVITRLGSAAGRNFSIWSPDGRYIILGGVGGMDWLPADGVGAPKPLIRANSVLTPWSFSPDGTRLAYHQLSQTTGFDLWTVPIRISASGLAAGEPEPFLCSSAYETYAAFSPDGKWIAHGSNESGNWEVYVRAYPSGGRKVQVSTAGGRIPRWASNGHELFYRTDDQRIMVANYTIRNGEFTVRSLRQWSATRLADTGVISNFDLAAGGKRVVALLPAARPEEQPAENHVTFVLNFFAEVRRRVPGIPR